MPPSTGETGGLQTWAGPASAGFVAFLLSLHHVASFDYWTHLALGRALWARGTLRLGEPFLLGSQGGDVVSPGWGFQALLYPLRQTVGDVGVCVAVALLAAWSFGVLWTLAPRRLGSRQAAIAWACLALAVFAARFRFVPRPEVVGYALAAPCLVLTLGWASAPSLRSLGLLGAIVALWAVVNPSWTLGALLCGAGLALRPRLDLWRQPGWRWAGLAAAAVLGVAGIRAASFGGGVLRALAGGGALAAVTEMQPLWGFPNALWPFLAAAAVSLPLAARRGEGRVQRLGLWTLALALGLPVARNAALSALVFGAVGAAGAAEDASRAGPRAPGAWVASGVLAVLLVGLAARDPDLKWGPGVRWDLFPRDAAWFVKERGLPGPALNTFDVGGYLDWAWGGQPPTFIDGRVFGENPRLRDLERFENALEPESVLARYGVRTVLLRSLFYDSGRVLPVVEWLLARPDWAPVRATDALVFTLRPVPAGLTPLAPSEIWRAVLREIDAKAAEGAPAPHLQFSRAVALLGLGDTGGARKALVEAVEREPGEARFYAGYLAAFGVDPGAR